MGVGSLCVSVKADVHRGVVAELGKFFLQVVQEFLGGERAGDVHVLIEEIWGFCLFREFS